MIDDSQDEKKLPYNSAGDISQNLTSYFRQATYCMMTINLYGWYKALEAAFSEATYKFKPAERDELHAIWVKINPYSREAYYLLKEYHIKLRDLCYKYNFFTMNTGQAGPAIWRR